MFNILYNIGIELFILAVVAYSFVNKKAAKRFRGNNHWKRLPRDLFADQGSIWFHCASLGEFEQARPIIDRLVKDESAPPILLTFFSPSGYEFRKDVQGVCAVTFMPFDRPRDVKAFLDWANVKKAVFIKYELWFNSLHQLKSRSIPVALVSAHFPNNHWVIKYPVLGRKLSTFDKIFTQNLETQSQLEKIGLDNAEYAGDTRFDRVIKVSQEDYNQPNLEKWSSTITLVIGSNWPSDDEIIIQALARNERLKVMVVPHELDPAQYRSWKAIFGSDLVSFSEIDSNQEIEQRIVFVDRMGLLSKLYRYADVTYIGGGFGQNVHNTLEAAVYGIPVIFGPNNARFHEIQQLKKLGAGLEINNSSDFEKVLTDIIKDEAFRADTELTLQKFFEDKCGASSLVIEWLEKR
jgi:3-deoxy-D-manno-octulosonic-acid transferase